MNFLQRAIYYFVGRASIEVENRRRAKSGLMRSYDAAKNVARFGDFTRSSLSANAELDTSLTTLRNRARGLYRNDPHVRRWVKQIETNVVGASGFTFRSRARNENGGLDQSGNRRLEEAWDEWAKRCTADGMMSFTGALQSVARTWARDGEVFAEILFNVEFPHGMAIHFFEADLVDETFNKKLTNGTHIRQGIELNKFERPVAYHVFQDHPGESFYSNVTPRTRRRVPAERVIHVFLKDRPGQVRGEPPTVAVMTVTKMLGGYREAEVTGRRLAASKMGFFKRILGMGSGDIAPLADVERDDGELEMEVNPGKLSMLPPGVDFEKFDMTTFSTDYEQFERQLMRSVAAGLDISYSNVSMDSSNSSYSSDRSEQIKQRDVWRMLQGFIKERFADIVYQRWHDHAFDMGHVNLPMSRREKFRKGAYFTPRGWSWVDPEKEIKAAVIALENRMTSLTRIADEQGRDVEEIFTELKAEQDLAAEIGLKEVNAQLTGKPKSE